MNNNNILPINFGAIEPPKIREIRGKAWVFFGDLNLFPEKLTELYNSSAMHKTAIDAKVAAIIGNGFKIYGNTIVNKKGETLNNIFERCSLDERIYGAYALNIIWSKDRTKIAEMYHIPTLKIRSGHFDEMDDVNEYYFSSDWKDIRKYKPVAKKAFDFDDNTGDNASQIYYVKSYNPQIDYYGLPDYVSALNDIELDGRIARFHNANISNGLSPSLSITFKNGIPTNEEKQEIYRDIEEAYSGEYNAGKFFLLFSEPGREPDITPIESANDTYYTQLEERVSSRILTSHRITSPLLLGIRSGTGLGSNKDELVTAYAHFFSTVCEPIQKKLVKEFNFLTRLMGFGFDLEIDQSKLDFNDSIEGNADGEEQIIIEDNE